MSDNGNKISILMALFSFYDQNENLMPIEVNTLANELKLQPAEVRKELKMLSSKGLIQCDIDWSHSILTKEGYLWLQQNR